MSISHNIKAYLIAPVVTAAALTYAYPGSLQSFEEIQDSPIGIQSELPLDFAQNQYYRVIQGAENISQQMDIMVKFVSNLLENTQDLDPRYSRLVDDHFWELL